MITPEKRSDAREAHGLPAAERLSPIRRDAQSRLHRSGYLALRDVDCEFRESVLMLRGQVPSYYLKQMAQCIVAQVEGVEQVFNMIEVAEPRMGHRTHLPRPA